MVCDTRLRERQTITERKEEIKRAVDALAKGLASGRMKVKVGPQGAVVFEGWAERNGVSDGCAYRRLLVQGGQQALMKIQAAEMAAGRKVNVQAVGSGVHSHDGGATWHEGH